MEISLDELRRGVVIFNFDLVSESTDKNGNKRCETLGLWRMELRLLNDTLHIHIFRER
jgi:hypothetical protein